MTFASLYPRITATRRVQDMCGSWSFQFDPQAEGERQGWALHLPNPTDMPVPASFADVFTDKWSREYTGDFWYQTKVFIPGEWRDGNVDIRFDSATHCATVYVNGIEITSHKGGFLPFVAHLNEVVAWNDWNTVSVKLNNELSLDTLPVGEVKTFDDGTKMSMPYFDFYNYSGLQRPVRLLYTPAQRVEDFTVSNRVQADGTAVVNYSVTATDDSDVEISVADEDGEAVAHARGSNGTLTIPDAHLWNLRESYLYTFTVRLYGSGGELIDEYYDNIGIRTVEVKDSQILINGRPVYLKGFGRHEDAPIHGRGFDPVVNKRDFEDLKWIGANSFRTSHYPYAEEQLYEADREGFFVIDEVAAVGMMKSIVNFLDAVKGNGQPVTFFEEPEVKQKTLEAHKADVRALIDRDKRHASVCAWSLFNEPDSSTEEASAYFKQIFELARSLDVQSRPCSYTNVTASGADVDKCHQYCDFIMLNRYPGWYEDGGYQMRHGADNLREDLRKWRVLEPNKPFIFTEFGSDTKAGVHKLPSVMWSEEYQVECLKMITAVFDEFDWVVGEQPWNLNDFQTTEGIMRVDGNNKGIFTRDRQPKMAAFFLRDRWASIPDYVERN